jgi:hypothetical protein
MLVIDGSSPDTALETNGTTAAVVSDPFLPPADPSAWLALWAGNAQSGVQPSTPTIVSSPTETWNLVGYDNGWAGPPASVTGQAAVWGSGVTDTPGSSTVTVTNQAASTFRHAALRVLVIAGADTTGPTGNSSVFHQNSGSSITASYNATVTGSWGFLVVSDWNAGDVTGWTPGTGQTLIEAGTPAGQFSYAFVQRDSPDGINGVTTTLSLSGLPAGGLYHVIAVEVIPDLTLVDATTAATDLMLDPGRALF